MKKFISLLLCLFVLCSCGKDVKTSANDEPVGDVTETQTEVTSERTTEAVKTTETEEEPVTSAVSTAPPRSTRIYTGSVVTIFKGPGVLVPQYGDDGMVHGTVSPVPVAEVPATTVEALVDPTLDPGTEDPNEPTTVPQPSEEVTADLKDQSTLSYEITKDGVKVMRSGKVVQTLSMDTAEDPSLIADGTFSQDDLIVAEDFDFDGYTDLFIKVRYGSVIPVNTGGVYFHYDPTTGLYSEWDALNSVGMLVNVNADGTLEVHIQNTAVEYEKRTYFWNGGSLALLYMDKQHAVGNNIYLDHYDYSSGTGNLYSREQLINGEYVEVSLP